MNPRQGQIANIAPNYPLSGLEPELVKRGVLNAADFRHRSGEGRASRHPALRAAGRGDPRRNRDEPAGKSCSSMTAAPTRRSPRSPPPIADPRVRALSLSRNFGKEAALSAGLDHARGRRWSRWTSTCRTRPRCCREMVAKWREGFEMVFGVRRYRESDTCPSASPPASIIARTIGCRTTRSPRMPAISACSTARWSKSSARMPERNRFMKGLFAWAGFRRPRSNMTAPSARPAGPSSTTGSCGRSRSTGSLRPRPCRCASGAMSARVVALFALGYARLHHHPTR